MGGRKRDSAAEQQPTAVLKKVILKNRQSFVSMKNFLEKRGDFFMHCHEGSVESIIHNNTEFTCVNLDVSGGRGHHLSRRFKADIDAWIAKMGGNVPVYNRDYKEQIFNLRAIEKMVDRPGKAVDANDCYWKTSYMLGYITYETYIIGLRSRKWKVGRNACIGALAKSKIMVPVRDGKPNYAMKQVLKSPIEYQYIRNHIIGRVYELFFRLYQELGDKFGMFLTDCAFVDQDSAKYVQDYLMKHGYRCKSHPISFTRVDRTNKKVCWYDFKEPTLAPDGSVISPGKNKYYMYAYHQVIDGVAESIMASNDQFLGQGHGAGDNSNA